MRRKDTLVLSQVSEKREEGKREELALSCYGETNIGRKRNRNEDSIILIKKIRCVLAGVFDGMGGMKKGDVASKLAVKSVNREFKLHGNRANFIETALKTANKEIYEYAKRNSVEGAMGTTGVLAFVSNGKVRFGNVGDSRLYVLHNGKLVQKTHDHTLVAFQLANGIITEEEAEKSDQKNVLVKALGVKKTVEPEIYPEEILQPGDSVLLCSDGLYNMAGKKTMEIILNSKSSTKEKVKILIKTANENGGEDNISAVLIEAKNFRKKGLFAVFRRR
ncbi:MAG: Stp1/IreP family PP2C-type Ser/Thr phosphatase [Caldisericaceae bacterium]|nr:Stp1/IreP family PP2C-type Ser/Thr phosphatase [Caldisericaceae bacterium]